MLDQRDTVMISRHGAATAGELLLLKEDGCRYESIEGQVIKMSPAAVNMVELRGVFFFGLQRTLIKTIWDKRTRQKPDSRSPATPTRFAHPDAAFVSHGRLATVEGTHGYLPLAPDLVVEVVTPGDAVSDVEQKAASWLGAGTRIVLVADPRTSTLRVYRGPDVIEVLHLDDTFDAGHVVPGWTLSVRDALGVS